MVAQTHRPDFYSPDLKDWKPGLGLARMTSVVTRDEKCWWLLQVRLTPYNASKAGLKYDPLTWAGTPLIRVIWVNRDGHLAEYQEWLEDGEEVSVPAVWELSVDEVIDMADSFSAVGVGQTQEWLAEAQASSTLIDDICNWEFQKSEMAFNKSTFGPAGKVQRNGFPRELRERKLRDSNWRK